MKITSARGSLKLDLDRVDAAEEDVFNRILWTLLKRTEPDLRDQTNVVAEAARAH
jgi:hypothetical protein